MMNVTQFPKHKVPEEWLNEEQKSLDSDTMLEIFVTIAKPIEKSDFLDKKIYEHYIKRPNFDDYPPEERAVRKKHRSIDFREPIPPEKLEEIKAFREEFVESEAWGRIYDTSIKKENLIEIFSLDYIIDVSIYTIYMSSYRESFRWTTSYPFNELMFYETVEEMEQFCSNVGFHIVSKTDDAT